MKEVRVYRSRNGIIGYRNHRGQIVPYGGRVSIGPIRDISRGEDGHYGTVPLGRWWRLVLTVRLKV